MVPNITSCTHRHGQFKRWSDILFSWVRHLEHRLLETEAEMSLGSSCRKTWVLTHQPKFKLWKLWLWKLPISKCHYCIALEIMQHLLSQPQQGLCGLEVTLGKWVTCLCSYHTLPRHVSVVLTNIWRLQEQLSLPCCPPHASTSVI